MPDTNVPDFVAAPAPLSVSDRIRASVAESTARLQTELPSAQTHYSDAVSRATGSGVATQSVLAGDVRALTPFELRLKYGNRVAADVTLGAADANSRVFADQTAERSTGQIIGDSVNSVGQGLTGLASVIGPVAGLVHAPTGTAIAQGFGALDEGLKGLQSDALNARRRLNSTQDGLDERDHTAQYQLDRENHGPAVAGLMRIGRDGASAVANVVADPMILTDGIANVAGSIGGTGILAKGLTRAGVASVRAATGGVAPAAEAAIARAAVPVAIGSMEGGGVYNDTVNEALRDDPNNVEGANRAGLIAAGITAPLAVAAGNLVNKFEGNPFGARSLRTVVGNLGREPVEEGAQGGISGVAQNVGLDRDLTQGVGAQIGLGGLFGFGAAGTMQAPILPGIGVRAAGRGVAAVGEAALGAAERGLGRMAESARQAQEATGVAPVVDRLAIEGTSTPIVPGDTRPVANPNSAIPMPDGSGVINLPDQSAQADASATMVPGATNLDSEVKTPEPVAAAVPLVETVDVPPPTKAVRPVTRSNINTPAGQQNVANAISVATNTPNKSDLKTNTDILFHADEGTITLTKAQRAALMTANAILNASQKAIQQQIDLGHAKPVDFTSYDVIGRDEQDSNPDRLSAMGHTQGILRAVHEGDTAKAKKLLTNFGEFVTHMSNKVGAINQAFSEGAGPDNQGFPEMRVEAGKFIPSPRGYGVTPQGAGSVRFAQRAHLETQTMSEVYQGLLKALPDLEGVDIKTEALNPLLMGHADTVAREFKEGERAIPPQRWRDVVEGEVFPPGASFRTNLTTEKSQVDTHSLRKTGSSSSGTPPAGSKPAAGSSVPPTSTKKAVPWLAKDQVKALSDEELDDHLNYLMDRKAKKTNDPEDDATFVVLDKEMSRRKSAGGTPPAPTTDLTSDTALAELKAAATSQALAVAAAYKNGRLKQAQKELDTLLNLVTHMRNMVAALSAHFYYERESPEPFESFNLSNKNNGGRGPEWTLNKQGLTVDIDSEASIERAHATQIVAQEIVDIYNELRPKIPHLTPPRKPDLLLHHLLRGKPSDVFAEFKSGKRVRPRSTYTPPAATDLNAKFEKEFAKLAPAQRQERMAEIEEDIKELQEKLALDEKGFEKYVGTRGITMRADRIAEYREDMVVRLEEQTKRLAAYNSMLQKGSAPSGGSSSTPPVGSTDDSAAGPAVSAATEKLIDIVSDITDQRLATASTKTPGTISPALLAEMGDVATLLNLLGIPFSSKAATEAPTEKDVLTAQKKVLELLTSVITWPNTFEHYKADLAEALKWFSSDATDNADRRNRAEKHAKKHGGGNLNAHYMVQLVEELGEVLSEQNPKDAKALEVQKRALKVLRFGASTVIKSGPYEGKTNQEAFDLVQAEADVAPTKSLIEQAYENLAGSALGSKIKNFFYKIFSLPKGDNPSSRLVGQPEPISMVRGILLSGESFFRGTGTKEHNTKNESIFEAYQDYLGLADPIMAKVNADLNAFLAKSTGKGENKTSNATRLREGQDVNYWANGKLTNIMEKNPDGPGQIINPSLLQGATLAALSWLQNVDGSDSRLNEKAISKLTGIAEDLVDPELMDMFSEGLTAASAKKALKQKILSYWGLKASKDAPIGQVEGLAEAMAAALMDAMLFTGDLVRVNSVTDSQGNISASLTISAGDYGLTETRRVNLYGGKKLVTEGAIKQALYRKDKAKNPERRAEYATKATELQRLYKEQTKERNRNAELNKWSSAIEEAVLADPEDKMFFGNQRPKTPTHQMHNPNTPLTRKQKAFIKAEQNTPFYFNQPMLDLYAKLGVESLVELFGPGDFDPEMKNVNHAKTLDGQARSVRSAIDQLMKMVNGAQEHGDTQPEPLALDQVPVHFGYGISKASRLQMLGRYGPQASKLVREALLSTRDTLDLSERGPHYDNFMLAIAQGLGVKIHTMSADAISKETAKRLNDMSDVVDMLRDFSSTGDLDPNFITAMKKHTKGAAPTNVMVHVLQEYARYVNASPEQRKAFTTSVYIEADGVTNGPINGMMLLSSGSFTNTWVNRMRKGGLSFTADRKTMNDQYVKARPDDKHKDMYQQTTQALDRELSKLEKELAGTDVEAHFNHLKVLMNLFVKDFSVKEVEPGKTVRVLDRGLAKNPLTITMYGSGNAGIAGNLVREITTAIYAKMSDATEAKATSKAGLAEGMFGPGPENQEKFDQFADAMTALTSTIAVKEKGQWSLVTGAAIKNPNVNDPAKFTFDPAAIKNMNDNMLALFVRPMAKAIKSTLGADLIENTKTLRRTGQIQSILQADLFNRLVSAKVAEKKADPEANYHTADFLSEAEMTVIRDEVKKTFPLIGTEDQTFDLAATMSSDANTVVFGRGFKDSFDTNGSISGPTNSGVSTIPLMVQGQGDADMMQRIGTANDAPKGRFMVFDGIHLMLSKLLPDSVKVNRAVSEGWLANNPMKLVHDGYAAAMKNLDLKALSDVAKLDLWKALTDEQDATLSQVTLTEADAMKLYSGEGDVPNSIEGMLKRLNNKARNVAMSVEARHRVIARVTHNVDQMAGAMSPYKHKGSKVLQGKTDEAIAAELDGMYTKELRKVAAEWKIAPEPKPASATPTTTNIWFGTKENAELSNLADRPFTFRGQKFQSVEQAYQSWKSGEFDQATYDKYTGKSGVKIRGKEARTANNWNVRLMERLMQESFTQNPDAMAALLATGSTTLTHTQDKGTWAKDFPRILTDIRTKAGGGSNSDLPPADTGTASIKISSLAGLLPKLPPMTLDQKRLLNELITSDKLEGYEVLYGSVEDLMAHAIELGVKPSAFNSKGDIRGFTLPGSKKIYLVKPSVEVLLHEMVHAATYETVLAHYNDNSTPAVKAAIERMEVMLEDFMAMDGEASRTESLSQAQAAIQAIYDENMDVKVSAVTKARALNEFMAWALANENLNKRLKRTKVNPLIQMAKEVIAKIMEIVFEGKSKQRVYGNMLSNLLFNSSIVMNSSATLAGDASQAALFNNVAFGNDPRLEAVQKAFNRKITDYLQSSSSNVVRLERTYEASVAADLATEMGTRLEAHGFGMTPQQSSTFHMIVAALGTLATIDANAMSRAQELYAHVTKVLQVSDFEDPNASDPGAERNYAQRKYDAIMGIGITSVDRNQRSSLLPAFMALAIVHPEFRDVLTKLELPPLEKNQKGTLDGILDNVGDKMMDVLGKHVSNTTNSKSVTQAIDGLTTRIEQQSLNRQHILSYGLERASEGVNAINDRVADVLEAAALKGMAVGNNPLVRAFSALLSEENQDNLLESGLSMVNKIRGFKPFTELAGAIIGRTSANGAVYDMIKLVHSAVQQLRQQYREDVPRIIEKQFSRTLLPGEWNLLHKMMGKTDLAVLHSHFTQDEILDLLHDKAALGRAIRKLEAAVKDGDKANYVAVKTKSQQLAKFMMTGIGGANLLTNANAVARLLYVPGVDPKRPNPGEDYTNLVDQLITLYALDQTTEEARESLSFLVKDEAKGLGYAFAFMVQQRKDEMAKDTLRGDLNHYKGYIPSETKSGVSLKVLTKKEFQQQKLSQQGYVEVGNHTTTMAEAMAGINTQRFYYYAPMAARVAFAQGTMQNVRPTMGGVDARTGFSENMVAGRITAPGSVTKLVQFQHIPDKNASLRPIFDIGGKIVAFERLVDPVQHQAIEQEQNLAKALGIWRGRQVEEGIAMGFNYELMDRLKAMHTESAKRQDWQKDYVNIWHDPKKKGADAKDAVIYDAYKLIPHEIKLYAEELFGPGQFWVRAEMLNDVIGYRKSSVSDLWTGNTRFSERTQENIQNLMESAWFLKDGKGFRALLHAENLIQDLVKDAKTLIVVKSVIVPMANFVSNVLQLMVRGVPITTIVREIPKKLAEINSFSKSRLREIEVEAELRVAKANQDGNAMRRLNSELRTIKDSYTRLSIWSLINAGEFSAISDSTMSPEDLKLSEGRLLGYIDGLVRKLPEPLDTVARYGTISQDTALFQGLQKAIQYGDFLGKAVLHDHLTKTKGKTSAEALSQITEEFVNYDRLPGRGRGYLEDMGLIWFPTFKIQSMKVALSMIRRNPVQALLFGMAPVPDFVGSVGSPITDNLLSKAMEGTLGYSFGPGMLFRSYSLNPWWNLTH